MKTVYSPLHAGHAGTMELISGAIVLMLMRADLARIQTEARLRRMAAE